MLLKFGTSIDLQKLDKNCMLSTDLISWNFSLTLNMRVLRDTLLIKFQDVSFYRL